VYCAIGDFYSQTQKKENELLKKNFSADLWKSMNELDTLVDEANAGSEIIILETYKTLVNLENSNMNDFAKAGISYDEQRRFLDNIKAKTENMTASEERAAEAKEYILGFYDRVVESIDGAE
jgi:serine/threonine-protein kinase